MIKKLLNSLFGKEEKKVIATAVPIENEAPKKKRVVVIEKKLEKNMALIFLRQIQTSYPLAKNMKKKMTLREHLHAMKVVSKIDLMAMRHMIV